MTSRTSAALGVATLIPALATVAAIATMAPLFANAADPSGADPFGLILPSIALTATAVLVSLALAGVFIVDVARAPGLDGWQRLLWAAALIGLGYVALPAYWWACIRPRVDRTPNSATAAPA